MIRSLLLLALAAISTLCHAQAPLSIQAQVGALMFVDKSLSGSGKMSCASCHDPANHYAPANDLRVQLGGPHLNKPGTRAVPTLTYKNYTPAYADLADNPDGVSPPGPGGGFAWDGRAGTLAEQAQIPLLSPIEMANRSAADVVAKLRKSAYAPLFLQAFGEHAFDKPALAFAHAMDALQAFQMEDPSFHPYSSKYDLYAGNKIGGELTKAEIRGFAVFQDPNRGNCAACHYSGAGVGGSVAQFTDYSYSAIGVPHRKGSGVDLGICGRADHPKSPELCGMFKAPTLRNAATRKSFFHNGQIASLEEAVRFYATRDTNPERWYPTVKGKVQKFNDLPKKYHGNIDAQMPLDGRAAGSQPPMSEQDIQDLLAFLNTLTDGYQPPKTEDALAPALERMLAQRGEICVAKPNWPIDVNARDVAARTRNAIQLPVLEKEGLVVGQDGYVDWRDDEHKEVERVPTRRYELTAAGRRAMKPATDGKPDLCGGRLELDRIVKISGDKADRASVQYLYRFKAEPWVQAEAVRRVFPMLDALLQGEGRMEMQQGFHLEGAAWVADSTVEPAR
ncbi:cytochrome c peroxidase [Pelomonas sp. KK5]|uniref:cytochrome c peroxidase n=1 Tax=Pelomonas sp. KK5 TaxID=1855730 RepID=UPI00097C4995|nr:cytochrome c peroxidase [Pelomonas sp. KK5]